MASDSTNDPSSSTRFISTMTSAITSVAAETFSPIFHIPHADLNGLLYLQLDGSCTTHVSTSVKDACITSSSRPRIRI